MAEEKVTRRDYPEANGKKENTKLAPTIGVRGKKEKKDKSPDSVEPEHGDMGSLGAAGLELASRITMGTTELKLPAAARRAHAGLEEQSKAKVNYTVAGVKWEKGKK